MGVCLPCGHHYRLFPGAAITPEQVNLTRLRRGRRGRAKQPAKVGLFPPNAFGLRTCTAAWEWCADVYATFTAEPQVDPLVAGPGFQSC